MLRHGHVARGRSEAQDVHRVRLPQLRGQGGVQTSLDGGGEQRDQPQTMRRAGGRQAILQVLRGHLPGGLGEGALRLHGLLLQMQKHGQETTEHPDYR